MSTKLVTAPTEYAITLAEAKTHLRVTHDDDNDYITALIKAAHGMAETITNRKLTTQTWKYFLENFPTERYIELPFPPVQSITHLKYKESNAGVVTTWDSSNYALDEKTLPARLVLQPETTQYPSLYSLATDRIEIQFVCGYGGAGSVPTEIKQAIQILVAQWYEHREPVTMGVGAEKMPMSADYLLMPFRVFCWPE